MSDDLGEKSLLPKPPPRLAPAGMRTFTVCRQKDETGISGTGIVIEGTVYATGQCVVHWLSPLPRGSLSFFESFEDFLKIHVKSHPKNETVITWDDGEQRVFHRKDNDDIETVTNILDEFDGDEPIVSPKELVKFGVDPEGD